MRCGVAAGRSLLTVVRAPINMNVISLLRAPSFYTFLGSGIQYSAQLALVLLVPKLLAPEYYVQFNFVLPLAFLGAALVFGWLTSAVYRHVHQVLQPGDSRYRQTVFLYYSLASLLLLGVYFAVSASTASIYRLVPLLLVAAGLKTGVLAVLNSAGRHKQFFLANLGFFLSTALFLSLCLAVAEGRLAYCLSLYAAFDVVVALIVWRLTGIFTVQPWPVFDVEIARRYFRYGLPLVINMIATWTISMSDRYLLALWEPREQVASYILSYQLGGSIITVPLVFAMALIFPRIIRIDRESGEQAALDYTHRLMKIYRRYMAAIFVLACGIVIPFKYFFYPAYEFNPALIMVIVLAHVIFGFTHFFNKEFELNGKTMVITKGIGLGAILNTGMNVALIPLLGVLGAAISTLIAYAATVFFVYKSRTYAPRTAA